MAEELGDVFFALIFIGKIGEKEKFFTLDDALRQVIEKLIRRHPHIFSNEKIECVDDIVKNWESIRKKKKSANRFWMNSSHLAHALQISKSH